MSQKIVTRDQGHSTWQGLEGDAPDPNRKAALRRVLTELRSEILALHRIEAPARDRARAATREIYQIRRRLGE